MQERSTAILGFQIALLAFAAVLLVAPADKFIFSQWQWARDLELALGRPMIFLIAGALLLGVPALRRHSAALLRVPTRPGTRRHIAIGVVLGFMASAGAFGAMALWTWALGGEPALARSMGERATHASEMNAALSTAGIVMFVFIAAGIAPVVEELVFRGMLYRAWSEAWGWVAGAAASSAVFALFHGTFLPQFLGGLVFVCVFRRTHSLRGAIYAHALFNFLLWYPLAGQFVMPQGRSTGEIHLWAPHLVCLALTVVLLPLYMRGARDASR